MLHYGVYSLPASIILLISLFLLLNESGSIGLKNFKDINIQWFCLCAAGWLLGYGVNQVAAPIGGLMVVVEMLFENLYVLISINIIVITKGIHNYLQYQPIQELGHV